ncbi:alpha/beta fold hydrolase [Streptomyces sp. NBC_01198]|uniref:alpha/beta fold hydrolase n=1 Tax=Streptomyces sp. NBC_01198 TaxID=2903769 RepID=UPI002E14BF7F|nr:alpha/beta hydrolase [Streptomyces sp. NBC_01198]
MGRITVGSENSTTVELYYEDHGEGQPIVLIHGFPLDGASWERQIPVLLKAGHRVITYDRRGFGRSSRPSAGYDYDTFATDLKVLMDTLDLRDTVLAGFSMGTGEVTRYLGSYGSERVAKAALFSPIPPFLLRTDDNPDGVERAVFDGLKDAIVADRPAFLKAFLDDFNNVDKLGGGRISQEAWQSQWNIAAGASPLATLASVSAWLADFRHDVTRNDVPTLVVQGTEDRILPIAATGRRLPALIADCRYVEIEGGPHDVPWTHGDELNSAFTQFLAEP